MSRIAALALVALCCAIHWPIDRAEFTFDDRDFIETNPLVTSVAAGLVGFAHPFPPSQPERALYRPLTGLSYAVDATRSTLSPRAFHITNTLLYAGLVLLAYRLALVYGLTGGAAFALAALFAAHPVHCDAVDSISGRSEVLSLGFAIAALLMFLRQGRDAEARAGSTTNLVSALLYAGACLAKETGAVLPAVLLVHRFALAARPVALQRSSDATRAGRSKQLTLWAFRPLLPHFAVLVSYTVLRSAVLGRLSPDTAVLAGQPFATRLWTMGSAFGLDLQQLIFPAQLELDFYYQVAVGLPDQPTALALFGWLAMLSVGCLAAMLGWRALRADAPLPFVSAMLLCGFALFFVPLFPTSHVLDIGALFAERFMFAPSLGFLLLVTVAAQSGLGRTLAPRAAQTIGVLLVLALVVAGGIRSHMRALEWRDSVQLWQAAGKKIHDKRIFSNLAAAYIARGQYDLALSQLDQALAIEPDFRPALGNRGFIQLQQGRLDAARKIFESLTASDPEDAIAWLNLGNIALADGDPETAMVHFRRALEIEPWFAAAETGTEQAQQALDSAAQRRR